MSISKKVGSLIEKCFILALAAGLNRLILKIPLLSNLDSNSALIISLLGLAVLFLLLKQILKAKALRALGKKWKNVYYKFLNFINESPMLAGRYTAEERRTDKYKKAMIDQIRNSKRIHIRLLSGHTMYFDDREGFILDLIRSFTEEELRGKDIKIQLLDRSAASFPDRAHNYVESIDSDSARRILSYEEYLRRCKVIEADLIKTLGSENVSFYKRKYLWRLHIFDNLMFISTYLDDPKIVEGHLSPVYSFTRECDASLFDGFVNEFESLYRVS